MSSALIDEVLAEYPDSVKVQILSIARKYRLDDDDPAFILMLAVGNLERLLQEHPNSLDANLMAMVSTLEEQRLKLANTAVQLHDEQKQNLTEVSKLVKDAQGSFADLAAQEVKLATKLQAQKISKGIEVGLQVKLAEHLKALLPVIASVSAVLFLSGLMLGILVGQSFDSDKRSFKNLRVASYTRISDSLH